MDCHAFEFMQRALQDLRKTACSLDARVSLPRRGGWGGGTPPQPPHSVSGASVGGRGSPVPLLSTASLALSPGVTQSQCSLRRGSAEAQWEGRN